MLKTDFFWTDAVQAEERLRGSFVLFGDKVALVQSISSNRGSPTASIRVYPDNRDEVVSLSDARFNRFRKALPIGWVNNSASKQAVFVSREPQRSRTHGMTRANTKVFHIRKGQMQSAADYTNFEYVATDPQYAKAIAGEFPPLELVLNKVRPNTTLAISSKLAVHRDTDGIRWLYVDADRVGLFTGSDTLLLLTAFAYVKEQLQEAVEFTVSNIKEF